MSNYTFYAHSLPSQNPGQWEQLETHLQCVAARAEELASRFDAGEWGRLAGLWHDLGKYALRFQRYLKETADSANGDSHRIQLKGTIDHSTAGACHAIRQLGPSGSLIAYCIAGHHGGLPNAEPADGERAGLNPRMKNPPTEARDALEQTPQWLSEASSQPVLPLTPRSESSRELAFQLAFFARMVFSCLVDADYLATEQFFDPERAEQRPDLPPSLMALLRQRADAHIDAKAEAAQQELPDSMVNNHRRAVLHACRHAATQPPGFFTLTVPTGAGKTLGSLAFALRHAETHGHRRVICAIPFTSIIEQNAAHIREALDDKAGDIVLEHHSNLDPNDETERSRLAAENWETPVVVTTNVQLFESLFANRTSRCRKLHSIANSVIVLDEVQALPPNLLAPTLAALRELVTNYGCTIVLCTATQPALEYRPHEFSIGIEKARPIIDKSYRHELFSALKRVEVEHVGTLDDQTLAKQLADQEQVLCIVNTKAQAAALFTALCERLGETETIDRGRRLGEQSRVGTCLHLSANMCPSHRAAVLRLIRRRLTPRIDRPCRVISTQLVEAGVDVDFPVVYRATAGLDAIAQAAGRCNREGKLDGLGRVVVFEPDSEEYGLPTFIRQPVNIAKQVLSDHPDPLTPEAQHQYFALHYWQRGGDDGRGWDQPPNTHPNEADAGVLDCFRDRGQHLQFRQAAERYRLIADDQQSILMPYGRNGNELVQRLMQMPVPPGRTFNRHLQRYVVNLFEHDLAKLRDNASLIEQHGQTVLGNTSAYDRRIGLRLDVAGLDALLA